jgi:hypothetical protein
MMALWPRHPLACDSVGIGAGLFMKITKVQFAGLRGATPEGGWSNEIKQDDCVHTLVAVYTDQGLTGWGSAFTNDVLVEGALRVLEPLIIGENPLEPERVSEKLSANTFWMGRGGSITHTISGIDIAVGHPWKGNRTTSWQAAWGALPRAGSAICVTSDAGA